VSGRRGNMMRVFRGLGVVTLFSSAILGQSPAFDAADVHMSARTTNPYTYVSGGVLRGGRYDLRKATMLDLIRIAWGVVPDSVLGGPNWLELDRFDVIAKAPPSTSPETVRLMLQALLADRFKLVLHQDSRPMPAFALTVPKGKLKLKEAEVSNSPGCVYQAQPPTVSYTMYSCRNITMEAFAQQLRGMAGDYLTNPVVDTTGLKGAWDFDVKWDRRSQVLQGGVERTTIFDAVDKQLGLMLELKKAPASVLVIDRVNEEPTANPPDVAQALPPRMIEFEVADLKSSRPDESDRIIRVTPGGGLEVRDIPMDILIGLAWDIDFDHVHEMVVDAPKWIDSARFDINAKTSTTTNGPPLPNSGFVEDDLRLMLRALLIDRFRMKTHYEDRPANAYTLVAARPKLRKADPSNRSGCKEARTVARDPRDINPRLSRLVTCRNTTMAQFAAQLLRLSPSYFAYPVADGTGMEGAWDFTLSFSPSYQPGAEGGSGDATASDPSGALSIFDAVNKQLGLKLEMRKRSMPVLVIDHMEEKPTAN
jgi:uncharacterized protein (TIGR03435 family)